MSTSTPACLNQPLSMAICQGVQPGQSEKPILSGVSALAAVKAEPSMSAAAVKRVVSLYARFMKTSQIRLGVKKNIIYGAKERRRTHVRIPANCRAAAYAYILCA